MSKQISKKYQKMDQVEHVLKLPDTYVGSVERQRDVINVIVKEEQNEQIRNTIQKKPISYIPAFYKIFDEIIANAEDQDTRLKLDHKLFLQSKKKNKKSIELVSEIKINIDKETGMISVYNDGDGIDIIKMKEHDMYPAELIFGCLLTSTNYDESQEKVTGGKNGFGAKLANIYSTKFIVETVDRHRKKYFKQEFRDNMSIKSEPFIKKYTEKPFTRITFYPEFSRFGMTGMEDDVFSLFEKRAYDVAAWTNQTVRVYFNDQLIDISGFEEYSKLYLSDTKQRVYEKVNDKWEILATHNDNEVFEQISFVNGINTIRGGKHVDYIVDQIKDKMVEWIKRKKKLNVKPIYVKNQLMVFVKATIVNPSFDGQTKETLTTSKSKFGSICEISQKFINQLAETGIVEKIIMQAEYKNSKVLRKTDGKKTLMIRGIPKLTDANKAGGKFSKRCTLILTEGDSAKSMAISGLSEVGRDYFGVFPLRGKLVNVKDADIDKILKNSEISNLKKIIGLKTGEDYFGKTESNWPLRYGKLMIMCDQDVDGSHIKGLLMNLFHTFWPSLLKDDFVTSLITPIIKATKGKNVITFYTLTDYEDWKKLNKNGKGWKIKYYKGLGTSTAKEAKEYFRTMKNVQYKWNEQESNESIDLAFNKKRSDDRKNWLQQYDRNEILDSNDKEVSYNDFIEKEFKHFSNYDLERSIPSICDGFKPSQRKILFSCFKRNLKNEIKVAQLAGYASEHSAYHHGEASLQGTIVKLAQNYVGSNNINYLKPNGQFGTRMLGGKDSASPRYIFTQLNNITFKLFNSSDFPLLRYNDEDGLSIEPKWYLPILPTVLINGTQGIGTGYSSNIPNFNPLDIIKAIKSKLQNKSYPSPTPWYRNFKGTITPLLNNRYQSKGIWKKIGSDRIQVTELPIGTWTEDYKQFLETLLIDKQKPNSKQVLLSFDDNSSETQVDFLLRFRSITLMRILKKNELAIDKLLKLTTTKSTNLSNMHLYSTQGIIKKYNSVNEIIDEFYDLRLEYYQKRKDYLLYKLKKELQLISYKVKFINEILEDTIDLRKKKKVVIHKLLHDKQYPKLRNNKEDKKSYDYLIKMPMDTLTDEKLETLNKILNIKQNEFTIIQDTTSKQMWENDLIDLESTYKKDFTDFDKKNLKLLVKKNKSKSNGKSKIKIKKNK